jgi:PEP-CTERM motif-containing protein
MRRKFLVCCIAAAMSLLIDIPATFAAKVWESTFDASADGVVDLFDNNGGKVMIGPAAGGALQITSWDNSTNSFTPDKSGRPLGATLNGNNTMSGQYKFRWSTLNQAETQAYEAIGFLGGASPQTRQILGGVLRHWKTPVDDHWVALDIAAGGAGFTGFGYVAGSAFYLGTNPTVNNYEIRVEYDGSSHQLGLSLLDGSGTPLTSNSADLDTDVPGLQLFSNPATELGSMQLTHLGWSDYSGNLGDRATVWQVDSLAYYNTARVPEPSAMALMVGGLASTWVRRRKDRRRSYKST